MNVTWPMTILADASAVFSADCLPTALWVVTWGRWNVVPGMPPRGRPPPSDVIRGRTASMSDTTAPTIGDGRSPGVSAVVWSARAWYAAAMRAAAWSSRPAPRSIRALARM